MKLQYKIRNTLSWPAFLISINSSALYRNYLVNFSRPYQLLSAGIPPSIFKFAVFAINLHHSQVQNSAWAIFHLFFIMARNKARWLLMLLTTMLLPTMQECCSNSGAPCQIPQCLATGMNRSIFAVVLETRVIGPVWYAPRGSYPGCGWRTWVSRAPST